MGIAMAVAFAYAGARVDLLDVKPRPDGDAWMGAARRGVDEHLALLVDCEVLDGDQAGELAARIRLAGGGDARAALGDAGFIIEAVPEVLAAKQAAFAVIDACAPADAVVASTTSSFHVDTLARLVSRPERFLNTHWLNPAYLMPLVEVSPGAATDPATLEAMLALLRAAGKVPVVVAASPGYIVPRVQALAMNEAARLVEEGVASVEDIDTASRIGFGLRFAVLGLLEFIDWGGADILLYGSTYLHEELEAERYRPPAIVAHHVETDRLGLKSGRGFYDFEQIDVRALQADRATRFVKLLRLMDLLPPPAAVPLDC
jgi:3-hydroxybutyryl-CoA dehydrogenase